MSQTVETSLDKRFDNARIVTRALAEGAVWECGQHPGVLVAHGERCECGAVQGA